MNKLRTILLDALILFSVSTLFVVMADRAFSGLKGKIPKDDPLVTAIGQGELKGLEEAIAGLAGDPASIVTPLNDKHGRNSLMRAAYVNLAAADKLQEADAARADMVALLLRHGAQLDALDHDGWTALMWAAWSNLPQVVNQLLEHHANLAQADSQGNTALIIAAQRGNVAIVKALLAKGADKTAVTKRGLTAAAAAETAKQQDRSQAKAYDEVLAALR